MAAAEVARWLRPNLGYDEQDLAAALNNRS
jgi:hypothetical protein